MQQSLNVENLVSKRIPLQALNTRTEMKIFRKSVRNRNKQSLRQPKIETATYLSQAAQRTKRS
ncbi:hypothetical protein BB560_002797 [Smittium megazygosporum]|uniref:Uncharacterized protein n=1 Tax=Smittium megazygosporum TaxID=133381 RepID=A0A2T9ZDW9_9FUNG|nr:hypothetical protein BB560_002797 [Smittium megazygosporum]